MVPAQPADEPNPYEAPRDAAPAAPREAPRPEGKPSASFLVPEIGHHEQRRISIFPSVLRFEAVADRPARNLTRDDYLKLPFARFALGSTFMLPEPKPAMRLQLPPEVRTGRPTSS